MFGIMTLNELWEKAKLIKYPILDRDKLIEALGDIRMEFEANDFDARDIALKINNFPINDPAHLIYEFLKDDIHEEVLSEPNLNL